VIAAARRAAASGVTGCEFAGNAALLELGDQAVIGDGQPAPMRLHTAEQIEQLVTIEAGQVELDQFVDGVGQLVEDMLDRCASLDQIEHAFEISGSSPSLSSGQSPAMQPKVLSSLEANA
jgi:hypothetical protein